jgi:peptide deformylase
MSLPHLCGEVERREKISIAYQDRFGAPQTLDAKGFMARVIAHEVDHLDGKLYPTRMAETATLGPTDIFQHD